MGINAFRDAPQMADLFSTQTLIEGRILHFFLNIGHRKTLYIKEKSQLAASPSDHFFARFRKRGNCNMALCSLRFNEQFEPYLDSMYHYKSDRYCKIEENPGLLIFFPAW
jgi:hypothetical protein